LKSWFSKLTPVQQKGLFVPLCITKFALVDQKDNTEQTLFRQSRFDLFIASLFENVNSTCDFWK